MDQILIGLIVGAGVFLWKIAQDGYGKIQGLRASKKELEVGIVAAETEKAEIEEETEHLRGTLDDALADLESLREDYDRLIQQKIAS